MKKEQILVLVAVAAAGVIVWSNMGLYGDVGAREIGDGKQIDASLNVQYDPQTGLPAEFGSGRVLLREKRTEQRPPLPVIERPTSLSPVYVRLLPWPYAEPAHWLPLRERIAEAPRPADDETAEDPMGLGNGAGLVDPFKEVPLRDMDKVARLVRADGSADLKVDIVPKGRHTGKPLWEVLRDWPNVLVTIYELNADASIKGSYDLNADSISGTYTTFHLPLNCENEYWERRVLQRVAAGDRGALMELARWTIETLEPKYGIEAVRLAVKTAEEALAVKADLQMVRELGELYRKAYDPEGELRVLQAFVDDGNQNNAAALELLADALQRAGALGVAAQRYETAANFGSAGARLGLGNVYHAMGRGDDALAAFRDVQASGSVDEQAAAHAGETIIHIEGGRFTDALAAAQRGVQVLASDAHVQNVLGAAQYYQGRYAEAEAAFRTAAALSAATETRARSNLGMALVAQGRFDDARAEFEACIEVDALNFVDPLVGLGDILQRQGYLTEANDHFETARVRAPANPWILLRLGTLKLRDGIADRALQLGREIVDAAPGSVDGLQLAGLAAGAKAAAVSGQMAEETDDAERTRLGEELQGFAAEALRHLERAITKEPENVGLLRHYVVALAQSGRQGDALKVLEKATAVGTGFARRDGRTLGLLAYFRFANRVEIDRVREAIDTALRAEIDEEAGQYLRQMRDTINDWDALRIWTEDFRRQGMRVLNGWQEDDERLNVSINATGQYVNFVSAANTKPAEGRSATSLERSEDAKKIRKWEAAFRVVSLDTEFVMHIYRGTLQTLDDEGGGRRRGGAELAFVVTRDGKMQIWSTSGSRSKQKLTALPILDADGNELSWPRDGEFHTVVMERTNNDEGTWQVYLDGDAVGEPQTIQQLQSARGTELTLGFTADAERGTKVEVHIDRVQILRTVD